MSAAWKNVRMLFFVPNKQHYFEPFLNVFGSCFRTLAVILASAFFFFSFFHESRRNL